MAIFQKITLLTLFFINLILLLGLKSLVSLNLSTYSLNFSLASSELVKNYVILLICVGELFLVLRLTKVRLFRNYENYQVPINYFILGPFLLHTQHHPACSCYKNHEITFNGHRICSGCYGSSIGILIGISILISTYFVYFPFDFYFYIGISFIQLALLKSIFRSYTRFILNMLFPLGINILLAGSFLLHFGIIYALLFIPILLIEFVLRLFTPNLGLD